MNKLVKKGFSMIELLFVMVILAALAAIAIPSMSSGTESATLTSMTSDVRNAMTTMQAKYVDKQDYSEIVVNEITDVGAGTDGFATVALVDGAKIPLSKGNLITITANAAAAGTCTAAGQGFEITVSNPTISGKTVVFDSCNDSRVHTVVAP
ncbi:type II secretion system protein [Aliarcobacter butzleri]|uniref:type II secretion system protein n=1 Tax=Aliarcobacter butzleri TaxID=28197 RepID=UPI0021B45D2D|nr:prepilin-type N-terminal cleavage/methylation domain-containing protein [Aliarcobacter butzleri]MCT7596079.1 prepilin-type N-terminal cleavage/methylation domain-containing protein [Aliarcobacter butzleri]